MTDCCTEGPKHTSSRQITCELFPLNDRPLHYWLPVCTRFWEIHLKAIQGCCVRQEAGVLAHRVIHSVTCTLRGLSPGPSRACAFVCEQYIDMHAKTCTCTYVHVTVWAQDKSSGSSGFPWSCLWPVITGRCPRYRHEMWTAISYGEMTALFSFYCATHPLSSSMECVRTVIAVSILWLWTAERPAGIISLKSIDTVIEKQQYACVRLWLD